MAAFKLAGEEKDWIPKPITCISYASPFVGSAGFRTAHEVIISAKNVMNLPLMLVWTHMLSMFNFSGAREGWPPQASPCYQ